MDKKVVDYTLYERTQARYERTIKRFIVALIIAAVLVFTSNIAWLVAWCQYDYSSSKTTSEITVDGKDGIANYIGKDGDILNGEGNSKEDNGQKNTP